MSDHISCHMEKASVQEELGTGQETANERQKVGERKETWGH